MTSRADKYRGATVQDLDPPAALSITPDTPISSAQLTALSHDYTHLTVLSPSRSLLGYLSMPYLQSQLSSKTVAEDDPVEKAMQRFARKGRVYQLITPETPLEELEEFLEQGEGRDFAVVTDGDRKFVLGVATKADLEEFVRRRPR
ncbi:MAG: hypothetical protein Q9162_001827 [Coniocarpon cinnabarinum]